jgi:hypothetical protein
MVWALAEHDRHHDAGKKKERSQETGQASPEEGWLRPLSERAPARELGRSQPDGRDARPVDAANAYARPVWARTLALSAGFKLEPLA